MNAQLKNRFDRFLIRDDLRLLEEKTQRWQLDAGSVLLREGNPVEGLYILRQGVLRVEKDHRGESLVLDRLEEGEFVGVMSFLDATPIHASIVAETPVEVDFIDGHTLHALLASVPGFPTRFYHSLAVLLAERLREAMDRSLPPFMPEEGAWE